MMSRYTMPRLSFEEWFAKAAREGECLIWPGPKDRDGYGRMTRELAHRVVYAKFVGPIPKGLVIDHLCFRRDCVEPSHLRAITVSENCKRRRPFTWSKSALGEPQTHCRNDHEYTPENTYIEPSGQRRCRACDRASHQRAAARKKAEKALEQAS